ncbi:hypothetical protein MVEN_02466500 [Mycena venus]|uniref:Uncharacterized protein n=1 Tax=Mycena venus TaxID=2733690 RepID=A0A8H6WXH0_9AGAR|nr:hypothetical protein MVEN_02466500 [Mycena venus]
MERRYTPIDLVGLRRHALVEYVQLQLDKWPKERLGKFNSQKTNMETMKTALLTEPFTTTKPRPPSHSGVSPATVSSTSSLVSTTLPQPSQSALLGASSPSQNPGPARLGVPDVDNEGYQVLFATIPDPNELEAEVQVSEKILCIPNSNILHLFILSVTSGVLSNKSASSSRPKAGTDKHAIPLTTDEFNYLRGLAENTPGFAAFDGKHNQRLVNLARVNFWRFAGRFCDQYFKASWPAGIQRSGTGRAITKSAIESVLGLGQTALNEAIQMTRLISIYYDEGPHRAEEVVKMVENEGQTADLVGADVLKKISHCMGKGPPDI